MSLEFSINERALEQWVVLEVVGRLDANVASDLKEHVRQVAESGVPNIILDMASVDFVDSSGLGALVASFKTLRSRNGSLRLCRLNDKVRMVFELIKLDRVLDIYPDIETALSS